MIEHVRQGRRRQVQRRKKFRRTGIPAPGTCRISIRTAAYDERTGSITGAAARPPTPLWRSSWAARATSPTRTFSGSYQKSLPDVPGVLFYRGVLYLIRNGGILQTLDPATGKLSSRAGCRTLWMNITPRLSAGDGKSTASAATETRPFSKRAATGALRRRVISAKKCSPLPPSPTATCGSARQPRSTTLPRRSEPTSEALKADS